MTRSKLLQRAVGRQSIFSHDASVVEGRVQSAELGDRPLDHRFYLSVFADVARDGNGSMALADQLLDRLPHRFLFDVDERHGRTRLRKRLCSRQPHTGTRPGDERNLVVEVEVVVHIRIVVLCRIRLYSIQWAQNLEGTDGADGNRLMASGDQFFCCGVKRIVVVGPRARP